MWVYASTNDPRLVSFEMKPEERKFCMGEGLQL